MAAIEIDVSTFPIAHVVWPSQVGPADLDRFFAELRTVYQRGRLGIVADIDRLSLTGYDRRARAAIISGLAAVVAEFPGHCVAEAAYMSSAVVRGLFVGYTWYTGHPHPTQFFSTHAEAWTWVERVMSEGLRRSG